MRLNFIGTGNAFCLNNYQSNILVQDNGYNLLLDCGSDIRFSLQASGLSYQDIQSVYVSHLHADHAGGFEYLAFCSLFDPSKEKINLFGHQRVLEQLWDNTLKGGLRSIQGKVMELKDYFNVIPIADNGSFTWGNASMSLVQSIHIVDGYSFAPSYGLMIQTLGNKVYWTSDAQYNPNQIQDFYNESDMIIQDCETSPYASGVHAHYNELKKLNKETKKKMFLIHYMDNVSTNFEAENKKAMADGFAGYAKQGQEITI